MLVEEDRLFAKQIIIFAQKKIIHGLKNRRTIVINVAAAVLQRNSRLRTGFKKIQVFKHYLCANLGEHA